MTHTNFSRELKPFKEPVAAPPVGSSDGSVCAGEYHIPLSPTSCIEMLMRGVPCEVPATSLDRVIDIGTRWWPEMDVRVKLNGRTAYITPNVGTEPRRGNED